MVKKLSDLMAEARLLMGDAPGAAMKLLLDRRGDRSPVPDAYDIVLARAAVAAVDPDAAIAHVKKALAEKPNSAALRRVCGEMLSDLGRFTQAGEQLHLAVAAGAPVDKFPLHLKLAMQDYLRQQHPDAPVTRALDVRAVTEFGVLDERHRVLFIYSPKVACTILKATVVMNSPRREDYLASGKPIHEFVGLDWREDKVLEALGAPEVFRFAVLRDPATRILSAYLNKFVTKQPVESGRLSRFRQHAVRQGQRLAGIDIDPERGITFEEFVHFLAQAHDLEMDPHWMPQSRIIGTDLTRYHHIGHFEALSKTFEVLEQRFGYVKEQDSSFHLGGQKNHATKYSADVKLNKPFRALPATLRRFHCVYPVADTFLTPDLRDILSKRFADDVAMYAAT